MPGEARAFGMEELDGARELVTSFEPQRERIY